MKREQPMQPSTGAERPAVAPAGPLTRLCAFVNLGRNKAIPRPPMFLLSRSRSLGLTDEDRGYRFDPERPYDAKPDPEDPRYEIVTQKRGKVEMRWQRRRGTGQEKEWWTRLHPLLPKAPRISGKALRQFLAQELRRRVMRPSWMIRERETLRLWRLKTMEESEEIDAKSEKVLDALTDVRGVVEKFLWALWTLQQRETRERPRRRAVMEATLQMVIELVVEHCVGDSTAMPLPHERELFPPGGPQDSTLFGIWIAVDRAIWRTRAKVLPAVVPSGYDTLELHWVANSFPGIIYADLLNAFVVDRSAPLFCCSYCGEISIKPPGGPGHPAKYCSSSCRERYSNYGSHDRSRPR